MISASAAADGRIVLCLSAPTLGSDPRCGATAWRLAVPAGFRPGRQPSV